MKEPKNLREGLELHLQQGLPVMSYERNGYRTEALSKAGILDLLAAYPAEPAPVESADEWARLDAANADEDARAEGYKDGYSEATVQALRDEVNVKADLAEKIAQIAEEAADELDLPVMAEWLDQRSWFKTQLHALAAKAREAGGIS